MKNIKCLNCGSHVLFSKEMQCPNCRAKNYGYDPVSSMPRQYRVIIDNGFAAPPIDLAKPVSTPQIIVDKPDSFDPNDLPTLPVEVINQTEPPMNHPNKSDQGHGWLIVHTEGKDPVDFPLKQGINYIGRPAPDVRPDIEVPDDTYVSRGHAVLEVIAQTGPSIYKLTDDNNNLHEGASTNGTHVNGDETRLKTGQSIYLKDGDTIQIGETKLVLKTPQVVNTVDEARTQVIEMNYEKTIFKGA